MLGLTMKLILKIKLAMLIALAGLSLVMPANAWAQDNSKGASDKVVRHFADTAFQSLPAVVKDAEGKEIKIDKKKTSEILVPDDQLREVILVASQVSKAAQCKLEDLANSYWATYRKALKASGKWTDQQRFFMARVFNVAVGFASAKEAKAIEGENEVKLKSFKPLECSDTKREALKAQILKNIKVLEQT